MASSSLTLKGSLFFSSSQPPPIFNPRDVPIFGNRLRRGQDSGLVVSRTKRQTFQILANPNMVPPEKKAQKGEVIMVDPLEAKRLAAKQLQEIRAKERFERKRRIEAINGAWAMIGLTAGLVAEGQTGKSILAQLAGYWSAFISFFVK